MFSRSVCSGTSWVLSLGVISIATGFFFCVCVQKHFCVHLQNITYSYTMILQRGGGGDEFQEHDVSQRVEQREGLLHNTLID